MFCTLVCDISSGNAGHVWSNTNKLQQDKQCSKDTDIGENGESISGGKGSKTHAHTHMHTDEIHARLSVQNMPLNFPLTILPFTRK